MAERPRPAYGPGSFMWYELATRDLDAARRYYAALAGWTYDEVDMGPNGTYQVLKAGDTMVGGMMPMAGDAWGDLPSHWGYYIDVEDVDAAARRVPELGGRVLHGPADIPEVGRFCLVADPTGAHVYLMTPRQHAAEPPCPAHGRFLWVELTSRDLDRAKDFYVRLLGWKPQDLPMPTGTYTVFQKPDGTNVGGGMAMPAEVPAEASSCWVGYIHVPDVDRTVAEAEAQGGQPLMPVMEVPGVGRFTQIQDPTGAVVAFMTPAPMTEA